MMQTAVRAAVPGVLTVALVAAVLQTVHLTAARHDPTFDAPIVDAAGYHADAMRLARGEPMSDDAFWQPPLLSVFLAGVYFVFGPSVAAGRVALAVLGVLSCLLVQAIGRRIFSERTGLLAGLMAAAYGPFVFYSTRLLPVGPAIFLILFSAYLWLRALDHRRWTDWLGVGLATGLATITVANAAVLLIVYLAAPVAGLIRDHRGRPFIIATLAVLFGFVLPVASVTVRNYAVSGEFVPVSTNGGINFFIGNNARSDETLAARPGEPWKRLARESIHAGAITRASQSKYFYRRTAGELRSDPISFLERMAARALLLLNGRELPRNLDLYLFREFSPILSLLMWRAGPLSFPFGLLTPLAALGMIPAPPHANGPPELWGKRRGLAALAALYGGSVVLFFVTSRYRLPMAMLLIVFAAEGLRRIGGSVTARGDRRRTGSTARRLAALASPLRPVAIAVAALVLILANLPLAAPTDGHNFRAELLMSAGRAHAARGDWNEAERLLRDSLSHEPQYGPAVAALGALMLRRGDSASAVDMLESALAWTPPSVEVRLVLADAYHRLDRPSDAESLYRRILAIDETSPEAHAGLARVLADAGRYAESIGHYRTAMRYTESPVPIDLGLADALVQVGEYEEAIERYRRAIARIDPDPETLNRVAWLLATCPEPELRDCRQAIEFAEHVCRLTDHRNASALDTLAAAYAECGLFSEAVTWAKAAIAVAASANEIEAVHTLEQRLGLYEDRLRQDARAPTPGRPRP